MALYEGRGGRGTGRMERRGARGLCAGPAHRGEFPALVRPGGRRFRAERRSRCLDVARAKNRRTRLSWGVGDEMLVAAATPACPRARVAWCAQSNKGVHVAAEKASILRVKVPSCQLPDSGT